MLFFVLQVGQLSEYFKLFPNQPAAAVAGVGRYSATDIAYNLKCYRAPPLPVALVCFLVLMCLQT